MRLVKLTILFSFSALLVGCGGNSTGSNVTVNSNAANTPQANLAEASNGNGADANAADAANANTQNSAPPKRAVKVKPEETPLQAPDDSEITLENNAQGELVETRIFRNHDMVAKVERTQNTAKKDASIKVYLKNGKVYELPAGKIKDVLTESPEEIIKAVGGDVAAASQAANKTQSDTKTGAGAANTSSANTASTPKNY